MNPHTVPRLNIVSLFAGIGGFERAFQKIGACTSLMCEIDPVAKHVLSKRLEKAALVDDVREIDVLPKNTDVLCAGFPCQDISSVGIKVGLDGERSSLVREVFRILESNRIEWVIFENVSFMLKLKNGQVIRAIADELERLGYNWAYRTIDSMSFVPQHRCRVFVVASLHHDPRNVILSGESRCRFGQVDYERQATPLGFYWTEGKFALGLMGDAVPTLKAGSTIGIPSPPAILFPSGEVSMPDIRDAERLQGFPPDWTLPAEEVARSSIRWRLVGNAVTVNAVSWIAQKIEKQQEYDFAHDTVLASDARIWPKAAWGFNGERMQSCASVFPASFRRSTLEQFLKFPRRPLSLKAAKGFMSRLQAGGLRSPYYFQEKINAYIKRMEAQNG